MKRCRRLWRKQLIFRDPQVIISLIPVYICTRMAENNRNNWSGIFIVFLVILFFSFFQGDKEGHATGRPGSSAELRDLTGPGLQAIAGLSTSAPESAFNWLKSTNAKFFLTGLNRERESVFSKIISSCFNFCQTRALFQRPTIGLIFLQKIPEQGTDDDLFLNS